MLNIQQREKLLKIARESIQSYLQTGKKLQVKETDPVLNQKMGAFVTLHKNKELTSSRGNRLEQGGVFELSLRSENGVARGCLEG